MLKNIWPINKLYNLSDRVYQLKSQYLELCEANEKLQKENESLNKKLQVLEAKQKILLFFNNSRSSAFNEGPFPIIKQLSPLWVSFNAAKRSLFPGNIFSTQLICRSDIIRS